MDMEYVITQLEKEWEQPDGFLGRLRVGSFDHDGLERLTQILSSVQVEDAPIINRRFVSLTWYIPIFMIWQRERVQEQDGDVQELNRAINMIHGLLEGILGIP